MTLISKVIYFSLVFSVEVVIWSIRFISNLNFYWTDCFFPLSFSYFFRIYYILCGLSLLYVLKSHDIFHFSTRFIIFCINCLIIVFWRVQNVLCVCRFMFLEFLRVFLGWVFRVKVTYNLILTVFIFCLLRFLSFFLHRHNRVKVYDISFRTRTY